MGLALGSGCIAFNESGTYTNVSVLSSYHFEFLKYLKLARTYCGKGKEYLLINTGSQQKWLFGMNWRFR